jgi:cysteine desulfurase/selenocysteine lyase
MHANNEVGTIMPIAEISEIAHRHGALVHADCAQSVGKIPVRVDDLGVDLLSIAGHKLYAPTGIGVLYAKREHLESMDPFQGGGDMIASVSFEETTFQKAPLRFEAGTPSIIEVIGMGAALDYVSAIGLDNIAAHEEGLLHYATERLSAIEGLRIIGTARDKTAIVSFIMDGVHAHDIGTIVDRAGVAIRVGHHCAQPVMARFGVAATARASFGLYNTRADVDALAEALTKVKEIFA